MRRKSRSVLPGFGVSLGITCTYLSLMVLLPLATVFTRTADLTWAAVLGHGHRSPGAWRPTGSPSAPRSSPPLVNTVFGLLVAWVLVRYRFPGRRLVDAMVDLPFALPTAVAGIALTTLYAAERLGRDATSSRSGIKVVLHLARHHGRPDLHRPAVRGAHGAAGARRPRGRGRGGGGQPGRPALADLRPGDPPDRRRRRCSPASRWPSPGRSASTARWSSSRATCR